MAAQPLLRNSHQNHESDIDGCGCEDNERPTRKLIPGGKLISYQSPTNA